MTETEISKVIKSLPNNKSPGADGLSSEYYKTFQTTLTPHLQKLFNEAATSRSFPEEMLKAIIVTLPKPLKEPTNLQNFRPVSLLNTDLKIFSKIIANRLAEITPSLINMDQVGFVKYRQASDGTRKMINLLTILESKKELTAFLTLDAEKAFNRVHWGYLKATLSKFGTQGPIFKALSTIVLSLGSSIYIQYIVRSN